MICRREGSFGEISELLFTVDFVHWIVSQLAEQNPHTVWTQGMGFGVTVNSNTSYVFKKVHNSPKNNLHILNVRSNILHGRFCVRGYFCTLKKRIKPPKSITMTMLIVMRKGGF